MGKYDAFSRDELIRRIEELEAQQNTANTVANKVGWFRRRFADKILDSIPDMLSVFDTEGTIVDLVSADHTNHSGLSAEELTGKNVHAILAPDSARNLKSNLDNVFFSGQWGTSFHDITLDGVTHNYENRIFPLDNDYALCMCRDITDELTAQQELATVKYALNTVDEEIYSCSIDGDMIYCNERFRSRNHVEGDIVGRKIYEFWSHAGSLSQWQERVQMVRNAQGTYKYTVRFKNDHGEAVVWDVMAYIMYDKSRNKEVVWFFGHDVTMRIIHENKLKDMNTLLSSVMNNIPVCVFVKDPGNEFRYLYWNKAFENFSGMPATKVLGHTDLEIFPETADAEKFRRDDIALLHSGERIEYEEEYVDAFGKKHVVSTSKALISMENRLPLIIGVAWDITDRKQTEAEVIEARDRAEQSDRLKSAFLANMSHEIRTPLNAIVGFSKLLVEVEDDDEKRQYADIIDTNSELLLQLINDILDISKIEAGTLEFKYQTMELNELCRAQQKILESRVHGGVELIFEKKYDLMEVECDQNRLAQVLTNLLTNACKFTRKGEIRFGFEEKGDRIEFYVCDTGDGIAPEKQSQIFERFVKLHNFVVGTGLGLAISKMIVETIGGEIGVESELGKGACFRFWIPKHQHDFPKLS